MDRQDTPLLQVLGMAVLEGLAAMGDLHLLEFIQKEDTKGDRTMEEDNLGGISHPEGTPGHLDKILCHPRLDMSDHPGFLILKATP